MNKKKLDGLLPQYKVEGFDPNDALVKIVDVEENGDVNEYLFMKIQPALNWFYTVFPDGCINHNFQLLNDRRAIVTASIYRNVNDARPAAQATVSRSYNETPDGKAYDQNAVTAAYRKALSYMGFTAPLDAEPADDIPIVSAASVPERAERGILITPRPVMPPVTSNVPPVIENPTGKNIDDQPAPEQEAPKPAKRTRKKKEETVESAPVAAVVDNVAPAPAPVQPAKPTSSAAAPKAASEPEKVPTTLAEAKQVIIPFGACVGMTIEDAYHAKDGKYIRWYFAKASEKDPNSALAVALRLFCSHYGI